MPCAAYRVDGNATNALFFVAFETPAHVSRHLSTPLGREERCERGNGPPADAVGLRGQAML